jgi:hypothetical protein
MNRCTQLGAAPPVLAEGTHLAARPLEVGPAWDEAFLRVESYLRAHHLQSRVLLNQLTTGIIAEAHERAGANAGEAPVVAAMRVTHERMAGWFVRVGHAGDWSDERVRANGRLALVLADVPGRWANHLFSAAPVPAELATALTTGVLRPGPELHFSKMSAAPLEFSFDEPVDLDSPPKKAWAGFRAASAWLAILGLYGAAWAAAH